MAARSRPARRGLAVALLASALAAQGARADAPALEGGRSLYVLRCQGCHGPEGAGLAGGVPDLRGALTPFTRSAAGRAYLVRVPGVAQSPLSDAELATVLNWLVAGMGGGADARFEPYQAAELGALRARPLLDVAAARRAVLAGAPPD